MRLAGQYGGAMRALLPIGDGLLMGHGTRVAWVDVSDPEAPRVAGLWGHGAMLDDVVTGIAYGDGTVCVSTWSSLYSGEFRWEDRRPPDLPGRLEVDIPIAKVVMNGSVAYLLHLQWGPDQRTIERSAVSVVWLTTPEAPRLVTRELAVEGSPADLLVAGGRLYVSSAEDLNERVDEQTLRLSVYGLADPMQPRLLAAQDGPWWGVLAARPGPETPHHVYALGNGLAVHDFSSPSQPIELERFDVKPTFGKLHAPAAYGGYPRLVVDTTGRWFIADNGGYASGVIWRAPSEPGGLAEGVHSLAGVPAGGFAQSGRYLFVTERGGRLSILDPTIPEGSTRVGRLDLFGHAYGVFVDRQRPNVLIATIDQGGFGTFIGADQPSFDPLPPEISYEFDGGYHYGLHVSGSTAAVQYMGYSDVIDSSVDLYSVGDPRRPERVARLGFDRYYGQIVADHGRVVYRIGQRESGTPIGVQVWNTSDLSSPQYLGTTELEGSATSFALCGDRLVVARYVDAPSWQDHPLDMVIELLDVSDPLGPTPMRSVDFEAEKGYAFRLPKVACRTHYAYVLTPVGARTEHTEIERYDFHVVDVAPGADRALGTLALQTPPSSLYVADGYAFVGQQCYPVEEECGLAVIDVRDPARPTIVGRIDAPLPDGPSLVTVVNGTVVVAAGDRGIQSYRPRLDWDPAPALPTYTPAPTRHVTSTPTRTPRPTLTPRPSASPPPTHQPGKWYAYLPEARSF